MGIFNDSSSLDTSRSILCFLRAGARSGPNSYEVYDRPILFVLRWFMRVGAVSGESEPLSILLFGLWSSGGSAQARLFWWSQVQTAWRLTEMRPQYGGLVLHWVQTMREWMTGVTQIWNRYFKTVKRGPNLDEPGTLINEEEISPPQEDSIIVHV
jgi:hypothetical protein